MTPHFAVFVSSILLSLPQNTAIEQSVADKPTTYDLAYKFEPGQLVHYEVTQSTIRNSHKASAKQVITDQIRERKHLHAVESREDGSFVLKTVFDHVQMQADFGSKKVSFDSKRPKSEDPPGFGHMRKSLSKPRFHVHFARSGELLGIKRLSRAGVDDGKSAGKNEDGSSYLVVFPSAPVKIGQTWKEEYEVKLPMSREVIRTITILRTYRLNAVKNGVAKITFATSLKTPVRNPEILAKLIQATPSGSVDFDIEAGQIVRRSMKVDETILNHSGPQSMLKTKSVRLEKRVVDVEKKTASTR